MIEFFALIALILFVGFLILTFTGYVSLFLNLILLIASYFLISKDLKDKHNHKYYLFSLLVTAIFFIFSGSEGLINGFLTLTGRMLISPAIIAVIAVFVFAHILVFVVELYHYLKNYKR